MNQIKIDREKNEVRVRLNEKFYPKEIVELAIRDYLDVCDVFVEEDFVILKPRKEVNLGLLGYEFFNYVLGLVKNAN